MTLLSIAKLPWFEGLLGRFDSHSDRIAYASIRYNLRNMLVTLRSRIYVGETLHYQGMTKIRAFENI